MLREAGQFELVAELAFTLALKTNRRSQSRNRLHRSRPAIKPQALWREFRQSPSQAPRRIDIRDGLRAKSHKSSAARGIARARANVCGRDVLAILVGLQHVTRYLYDRPVSLGPQIVRLRPAPHCRTKVPSYSLKVAPANHFVNWQQDPHGNWLARFVFPEKTEEFSVEVDLTAELAVINPFDFFVEPYAEEFPFAYPDELKSELAANLVAEPAGPLLTQIRRRPVGGADAHDPFSGRSQCAAAKEDRLCDPHGARRPGARRDAGAGVGLVPRFGVAARADHAASRPRRAVRVGLSDPAQGRRRPASRGRWATDHDFTDLHAWAEVYIPGAGWIGFDATSGLLCGEGHLPLCATPHYQSAAPISGVVEPAQVRFEFQHEGRAPARSAARHPALFGRSLGEARRFGRPRRSRS